MICDLLRQIQLCATKSYKNTILSPLICIDRYVSLKHVANPVIKVCGSLKDFITKTRLREGSNHGRVPHAIHSGLFYPALCAINLIKVINQGHSDWADCNCIVTEPEERSQGWELGH